LAPALFSVAIHDVLEELSREHPGLCQVWYLDDGVLYGPPEIVEQALRLLELRLRDKGLILNRLKCELYKGQAVLAKKLEDLIPHPEETDEWCYLGVPVSEETDLSVAKIQKRTEAVLRGVAELGNTFPAQALQLLRLCASACKVEFALQALPQSPVTSSLATSCALGMRKALSAILRVDSLSDAAWTQATLPLRRGGLGLRDPTVIGPAARLANTVNAAEKAQDIGANDAYLAAAYLR
jgi:hypothetical protein